MRWLDYPPAFRAAYDKIGRRLAERIAEIESKAQGAHYARLGPRRMQDLAAEVPELGRPMLLRLRNLVEVHGAEIRGNPEVVDVLAGDYSADLRSVRPHKPPPPIVAEAPDDDREEALYDYNEISKQYIFPMPRRAKPLVLDLEAVRTLCRDYSTMPGGRAATINQIAIHYELTRREVRYVIRALGLTHDSEPFPPEDLTTLDEDELVDQIHAEKRRRVTLRFQKENWDQIKKDADKWNRFEEESRRLSDHLAAKFRIDYEAPRQVPIVRRRTGAPWSAVLMPTDFHYGKLGWAGFGCDAYDLEIARTRLWEALERTIARFPSRPERIVLPIGSDAGHIDTALGTTTRGTPQDVAAYPEQIAFGVASLFHDLVAYLKPQTDRLDLVYMPGNHDRILTATIMGGLVGAYRSDPIVHYTRSVSPYQWLVYGSTLLGFHHGDGVSGWKDLALLMANLAPEGWARCPHRLMLTGNLHHVKVAEEGGILGMLCPSLAGTDRWHVEQGHVLALPAMHTIALDRERGPITTWRESFPPHRLSLAELVTGKDAAA